MRRYWFPVNLCGLWGIGTAVSRIKILSLVSLHPTVVESHACMPVQSVGHGVPCPCEDSEERRKA